MAQKARLVQQGLNTTEVQWGLEVVVSSLDWLTDKELGERYWNMELTKTERKILVTLRDGRAHLRDSVVEKVMNGSGSDNPRKALISYICRLNIKLRTVGEEVVCIYREGRLHYRLMRQITSQ